MFNHIKYSIIRAVRDKEYMILSIIISLAMGTVMFFFTGTMLDELQEGTLTIPIGVVELSGNEHEAFLEILDGTDGLFEVQFLDYEEALYELEMGNINGIFEVGSDLRLLVTQDGFSQLILQMIADEYLQRGDAFVRIATENPQYLERAIMNMTSEESVMSEMDMAAAMPDMMQNMLIFLIAITSLSGVFVGFERAIMVNNDGSVGSRRITSPVGKVKMLFGDLIGVSIMSVVLTLIVWGYYAFVLNASLGVSVGWAILGFFITALFGVSFGALFGLVAPGKKKTREQILNGAYMIFCMVGGFGQGLRGVAMIDLINSVNPMILLVEAILALNMGNVARYVGFVGTIAGATVVLTVAIIITLRRNRYVDIK